MAQRLSQRVKKPGGAAYRNGTELADLADDIAADMNRAFEVIPEVIEVADAAALAALSPAPKLGDLAHQVDTGELKMFDGGSWQDVKSAGAVGLTGRFDYAGPVAGGTSLTVTVDGTLYATFSLANVGGGNTTRGGAGAVTVDIGGGAGNDVATFMLELKRGFDLLAAAGDPLPVFISPTAAGIAVNAPWASALVLASDDAGVTAVNP